MPMEREWGSLEQPLNHTVDDYVVELPILPASLTPSAWLHLRGVPFAFTAGQAKSASERATSRRHLEHRGGGGA